MEFSFNVNELFKDEITCVDNSFQPCRQGSIDRHGFCRLQNMLYEIVDQMGDASAKAQNLRSSITTGRKLEISGQRLYVMKDSSANSGKGCIVGILKVGTKKLFVYDSFKVQHELQPLCVLDFYIHESRQRMGQGRRLFDFMLKRECVPVQHLAIDRPSAKFLSFLAKHYGLQTVIPQVNNFVIFERFFYNRSDLGSGRNRKLGEISDAGYSNWMTSQGPRSGLRNPHHLPSDSESVSNFINSSLIPKTSNLHRHMAASDMTYSRHAATPGGSLNNRPAFTEASAHPEPVTTFSDDLHGQPYSSMLLSQKTAGPVSTFSDDLHGQPYSSMLLSQKTAGPVVQSSYYSNQRQPPYFGTTSDHSPGSVTHFQLQPSKSRVGSPLVVVSGKQAQTIQTLPPVHLPQISANQNLGQISANQNLGQRHCPVMAVSVSHRPSSGKQNYPTTRKVNSEYGPPLLQRDGLPSNYRDMLNMHQTYQQRNGHLNVSPGSTISPDTDGSKPTSQILRDGSTTSPVTDGAKPTSQILRDRSALDASHLSQNTSWTVMGVLRDQTLNAMMTHGYATNHRLW